jgi:porphobilinogen synthase
VLREALAETHVLGRHLIQPHFVLPSESGEVPVPSMPGVSRLGLAPLLERVRADLDLGLGLVLLFGLFEHKDAAASSATDPDGVVPRAVRRLKEAFGEALCVFTDVCLCGSTDHGHCGVLEGGRVRNDASLPLLAEAAVAHARAGADFVAPSDMMDGRVAAIRGALDEHGLVDTGILSYSSKFASAFYGPFRDAADSAPQAGDRKSYQLDPRNAREALREKTLLAMRRAGADLVISYHAREALAQGWIAR